MRARTRILVQELGEAADASRLPGMRRVGINVERALGVSIPHCRSIARRHRGDHNLAVDLWTTRIHEARIVAAMVDDPLLVTEDQMEAWVRDFDSWDLCDQVCGNLFTETPTALGRARLWVRREEEFVKRAGFVIVAECAARGHGPPGDPAEDATWIAWIPEVELGATDERNYVKKAVNWALRQIGKRNRTLNAVAIGACERLLDTGDRTARWIARDALRELQGADVQRRLHELGSAGSRGRS